MDKLTQSYRLAQLKQVKNGIFSFAPRIKIIGALEGETNYLDLSEDEYKAICDILTDPRRLDT